MAHTYDDWGPISKIEQDHDSAIGGTMLFDVDFTYAKATSGRNTIRRSTMDLPDGQRLTFDYLSTGSLHDDDASRVSRVKIGEINQVTIVEYDYNGVGQLVGTEYPEVDVMSHRYGSTSGSYPDLDRFGRVVASRWTKDLATDRDFFDLDVTYDRNSNITLTEDNVHDGFDVDYEIDALDRLTNAEEKDGTGTTVREQTWTTLSQTGNWDQVGFDLDGEFTGTGAYYDDTRTHNLANELTARDIDSDTTDDYTLSFTDAGQLEDDGENYEYTYDAFGRLRKISNTTDQTLVAEYVFNGFGHRIAWHYDVDADGDVDANDPWYRFVYDDQWRVVATYRGASATTSDSDPKEQFVYHNAGDGGLGTASYIDDVILRDKDANTTWSSAADGTLEERVYYCQNWRHDVVALIDADGEQLEQVRYTAYGIPDGLPAGDADSDGDVDSTDANTVNTWITAGYDVRGDLDLDGDVDFADYLTVSSLAANGVSLGLRELSRPEVGNRKGFAGYELADELGTAAAVYHVRYRVYSADLGRWLTRDPAGYVDGANLCEYVGTNPVALWDPFGLIAAGRPFAASTTPVDPCSLLCYGPPENCPCAPVAPVCGSAAASFAISPQGVVAQAQPLPGFPRIVPDVPTTPEFPRYVPDGTPRAPRVPWWRRVPPMAPACVAVVVVIGGYVYIYYICSDLPGQPYSTNPLGDTSCNPASRQLPELPRLQPKPSDRCDQLNRLKKEMCSGHRSCQFDDPTTKSGCGSIKYRIQKNELCEAIRKKRFKLNCHPDDDGHRRQLKDVGDTLKNCRRKLARCPSEWQ